MKSFAEAMIFFDITKSVNKTNTLQSRLGLPVRATAGGSDGVKVYIL